MVECATNPACSIGRVRLVAVAEPIQQEITLVSVESVVPLLGFPLDAPVLTSFIQLPVHETRVVEFKFFQSDGDY